MSEPIFADTALVEDRKQAAEAAALVGPRRRHEFQPVNLGKQRLRLGEIGLPQFRGPGMTESAERAATVVQTDFVRKARPRKSVDFQDVVEKLDQFIGAGTNSPDCRGLFHRRKVMTNMMDAASGRTDDVVETVEVANK